MKYMECNDCGAVSLVQRDFCPKCRSENLDRKKLTGGRVIYSVKLVATPEPYPQEYFLVLAESGRLKFYCRSDEELGEGEVISLTDSENGVIGSRS